MRLHLHLVAVVHPPFSFAVFMVVVFLHLLDGLLACPALVALAAFFLGVPLLFFRFQISGLDTLFDAGPLFEDYPAGFAD